MDRRLDVGIVCRVGALVAAATLALSACVTGASGDGDSPRALPDKILGAGADRGVRLAVEVCGEVNSTDPADYAAALEAAGGVAVPSALRGAELYRVPDEQGREWRFLVSWPNDGRSQASCGVSLGDFSLIEGEAAQREVALYLNGRDRAAASPTNPVIHVDRIVADARRAKADEALGAWAYVISGREREFIRAVDLYRATESLWLYLSYSVVEPDMADPTTKGLNDYISNVCFESGFTAGGLAEAARRRGLVEVRDDSTLHRRWAAPLADDKTAALRMRLGPKKQVCEVLISRQHRRLAETLSGYIIRARADAARARASAEDLVSGLINRRFLLAEELAEYSDGPVAGTRWTMTEATPDALIVTMITILAFEDGRASIQVLVDPLPVS